ncbi:unnamed protein product, partial [Urochloa humidicola]
PLVDFQLWPYSQPVEVFFYACGRGLAGPDHQTKVAASSSFYMYSLRPNLFARLEREQLKEVVKLPNYPKKKEGLPSTDHDYKYRV